MVSRPSSLPAPRSKPCWPSSRSPTAASRSRSTPRSCRAASGRSINCQRARGSRSCARSREAEVAVTESQDTVTIGGRQPTSRLLLGTGGFRSLDTMAAAIEASGTELVTVALRRIEPSQHGSIVSVLDGAGVKLLPNTAGCFTARDAVLTARMAREAFGTDWIKLEVIGDE